MPRVSQKDAEVDEPRHDDFYSDRYIDEILKINSECLTITVFSNYSRQIRRLHINQFLSDDPYFIASVNYIPEGKADKYRQNFQAIVSSLKDLSLKIVKLSATIPHEVSFAIKNIDNSSFLINFICSNSDIPPAEKQALLEVGDIYKRAEKLLSVLANQVQMLELKNEIQIKVKKELDKQQKEYLLHQQMKTIQQN